MTVSVILLINIRVYDTGFIIKVNHIFMREKSVWTRKAVYVS